MSRLIVIGASAGGVTALMQPAAAMPADLAAPVLIVPALDPLFRTAAAAHVPGS